MKFKIRFILIYLIFLCSNINCNNSSEYVYENNENGFYNYCPSVIKEDDVYHLTYCANSVPFDVTDSIYYRKSIKNDEYYNYSDEIEILSPSPNEWDSVHVCDPSIISGDFNYNNQNYKYLMAYLGCNTTNSQENKIGFAVSNNLDKGWIKTKEINPIISIPYDYNHKESFQWGVGQPSLINLNNDGKILIFYTQGTYNLTSEIVELWDLSNLNNPVQLWKTTLSNKGMNDFISNADFIYTEDNLYMISDVHPFNNGILSNIPDKLNIYQTSISDFYNKDSYINCEWTLISQVSNTNTNYKKNHNGGFIRGSLGEYVENSIAFSYAIEKNNFLNSLWTYRFSIMDY